MVLAAHRVIVDGKEGGDAFEEVLDHSVGDGGKVGYGYYQREQLQYVQTFM